MNRDTSTFVIYGLYVANGDIRYVGLTTRVAVRLRQHQRAAATGVNLPVYRWMRKHGEDSVCIRILSYALTFDDLKRCEMWWIAELKSIGHELLNLTDGGEGVLGWKHSAETRARIAAGQLGRTASMETREKLRTAATGRKNTLSASSLARVLAAARENGRRTPSAEARAKMSASNRGKKRTPEQRAAIAEGTRRAYERKSRLTDDEK